MASFLEGLGNQFLDIKLIQLMSVLSMVRSMAPCFWMHGDAGMATWPSIGLEDREACFRLGPGLLFQP